MKDWIGNKTSVSATLGASNLSNKDRAVRDYYATSPSAINAVLPYLDKEIPIWECACGEGHLSKTLKEKGYVVKESDIVVRSYPCEQIDFLWMQQHERERRYVLLVYLGERLRWRNYDKMDIKLIALNEGKLTQNQQNIPLLSHFLLSASISEKINLK